MQAIFKRYICCITVYLIFIPSIALAIDLNAPAEKKVTVGSEIDRGSSAIFDAGLKTKATDIMGKLKAFSRVFDLNQQNNKDTQAFLLGASFAAWAELDIVLELAAQNHNSPFFKSIICAARRGISQILF